MGTNMDENEQEKKTLSPEKAKKIKRVERCVLSILLAAILAAVGFIAGWFGRWGALGKYKQSLLWAIDTAQKNYYKDVDKDKLYESLFAAFSFDRYSTYYTNTEYETVESERDGVNRDAGFSVYGEESYLEVYDVIAGSSAAEQGITHGMRFWKFGKTEDTMKAGTAEDYFSFVANLDNNEEYYVKCGEGEKEPETAYKVVNGERGAGISLTRKFNPMRVYQVVGNSPADHVGLRRGMYILKYGASDNVDEMVSGSSSDFFAFVNKLKPDENNRVTIHIQAGFEKEVTQNTKVYSVTMTEYNATYCYYRDSSGTYCFRPNQNNKLELSPSSPMGAENLELDDHTAYIALTQFTGTAAAEFKECLNKMKESGRKHLILDLRGNGGGYMDVFVEIAACLLKETSGSGAQKVAYAKFKDGATVSYSARKSLYKDYFVDDSHISVLADEYTASASECLIGALIDYKTIDYSDIYLRENENGVAKSYGKGIMQTHFEDKYGNTLKLTSAEIFWPKSNKTIHDVGVTPQDGAVAIPSALLPDEADSFLQRAVELIKNKQNTPPEAV